MLKPDFTLYLWNFLAFLFWGLTTATLIKLLIVLFKADRFMDEVRDYIRRQE
ncbi:hypothetical protein [Spirosoma gilvum]